MRRPKLTRRGEVVVMAATAAALTLVVIAAGNAWLRAYGLAAAAVLGLLFIAMMVTTLVVAALRAVRWLWLAPRRHRARAAFTAEALELAEQNLQRHSHRHRSGRPCAAQHATWSPPPDSGLRLIRPSQGSR